MNTTIERKSPLVSINVSGTIFEFPEHLITRTPADCRLRNFHAETCLDACKRPYYNADPDVFRHVMAYMRTNELHLPLNMCGVANSLELKYWGLDPCEVERCCWNNMSFHRNERKSLKKFESFLFHYHGDADSNKANKRSEFLNKLWKFFFRPESSKLSIAYAILTVLVALLSVIVLTTETVVEYLEKQHRKTTSVNNLTTTASSLTYSPKYSYTFMVLEDINLFCCVFFTVDIFLRFIACPKKVKFCVDPLNILDVLSIASFYVEYIQELSELQRDRYSPRHEVVNYARIARVLAVFRIIRVFRFYFGFRVLIYTFRSSIRDFMVMVVLILTAIAIFGSLFYMVESNSNSDVISIPEGFYWALITITTVGYGDITPRTTAGKIVASLCAIAGVLTIAFSVPLIVSKFLSFYQFASDPPNLKQTVPHSPSYSFHQESTDLKCTGSAINTITSESMH